MNQYQAYSDENPASVKNLALDVATAPIKPSTYAWMYTHVPGMWSGTEGVKIPFDITRSRAAFSVAGKRFKDKKFVSGIGHVLKGTVGAFAPFKGDRIGKTNLPGLERKLGVLQSKLQRYSTTRVMTEMEMTQSAIDKAWEYRDLAKHHEIASRYKKGRYVHRMKQVEREILDDPKIYKAMIGDIDEKISGAKKGIGRIKSKIFKAKSLKWGIRAGKLVSTIGATMFAWDVAKMIGQPLGRAAISEYGSVMDQFNDRFMPELGGRLEMSYLTRGAATERQRALEAMSRSQITGRSAFGQEAKFAHS